jgi:hypothetical protein
LNLLHHIDEWRWNLTVFQSPMPMHSLEDSVYLPAPGLRHQSLVQPWLVLMLCQGKTGIGRQLMNLQERWYCFILRTLWEINSWSFFKMATLTYWILSECVELSLISRCLSAIENKFFASFFQEISLFLL